MDNFAESIGIQLADERTEIVVLEILWQDLLLQSVGIADNESVSFATPADDGVGLGIGNQLKSLAHKRGGLLGHFLSSGLKGKKETMKKMKKK